jgi:AraC family transcriptional activator of pobA
MEETVNFDSINKYNTFNNNETLHPLVSVVDVSKADKRKGFKANFGFYCVLRAWI